MYKEIWSKRIQPGPNGMQVITNPDSSFEYMWRVVAFRKNCWKTQCISTTNTDTNCIRTHASIYKPGNIYREKKYNPIGLCKSILWDTHAPNLPDCTAWWGTSRIQSPSQIRLHIAWQNLGNFSKGVFGTVPVFSVPAWMSYHNYRSVWYRYWCRTEITEVSGTGIDVVPSLKKCPVPVLVSCWTYRSVRHRYRCRTKVNKVSGTGIDDILILPKFPVPVLVSYLT